MDRILIDKGPKRISPFLLPSIIGNTAGSMVAIELGAKAVNYGVVLHARHAASGPHAGATRQSPATPPLLVLS